MQSDDHERGLAMGALGPTASLVSTAYSAYVRAQGHQSPVAVAIGWGERDLYMNQFAHTACIVAPVHATVVWLRRHLATERGVETTHLRYASNRVALNDDDYVYDVCRHLKPHRIGDMLEAVLVDHHDSTASDSSDLELDATDDYVRI